MVQEYDAVRGVTRPLSESEPALCSAWSRRQTKNSVRWVIPLSAVVLNRAIEPEAQGQAAPFTGGIGEDHGTYDSGSNMHAKALGINHRFIPS